MKHAILYTILTLAFFYVEGAAQNKRDYQWIIGGSNTSGWGILMDFNDSGPAISLAKTNIKMEGSNTSMSDEQGRLLFYSNGCKIMNANFELMKHGDSINPGLIQKSYCPSGGSPIRQGVIALPAPESDSLFYVFNLDFDLPYEQDTNYLGLAPLRLYYQVIDMTRDSGLGAVIQKNQIAVMDTLARASIQAVRHANGKDWWVIVPESHSNCYHVVGLTSGGIQTAQRRCSGHIWDDFDSGTQVVFTPDTRKYIRFNAWNGLNIFDFDNNTGELSNPVNIMFPNDTIRYTMGAAVSPNSRYLYICALKKVYQFDLQAPDIAASKVLIAVWDGFSNPFATIFYMAALGPDGKIYISSTSSTLNLHVINKPNCPGLSCELIQHGIDLPAYNFATIPNMAHYRMSDMACDTTSSAVLNDLYGHSIALYPNPVGRDLWINVPSHEGKPCSLYIYDLLGQEMLVCSITQTLTQVDVSGLKQGTYIYVIGDEKERITGRLMKIDGF